MPLVVLRKCTACGKITDRKDLIRILKNYKTSQIIINPNPNEFGRSTYICRNPECLKNAIKKKRLKNLTPENIEEINNLIN